MAEEEQQAMAGPGEQPKRVTGGPFGRYMAEHRAGLMKECASKPELLRETGGRPAPAAIKLGSERFKQLDAEARAKYEKIYEAAKQKYEEELETYKEAGGTLKKNDKRKGKNENKENYGEKLSAAVAAGDADGPPAKKVKIAAASSDVEVEAKQLGLLLKFLAIDNNPKVKSTPSEILAALKEHNGSVVKAKGALLGA